MERPISARLPLLALLTANAISATGNSVALVAIPWLVLETTGSGSLAGLTAAATVLPTVLAGALAGTLVDRLGHRRSSVVSDLLSATAIAAIPLLDATVGLAYWQLLALVFLGALLDVPGITARQSLIPDLATQAGVRLERANAAAQAVFRAGQIGGPLLAGVLIVAVGATGALVADSLTFVVSAALIVFLVPRPAPAPAVTKRSYLSDLREGVELIRRDRVVRSILVVAALSNFVASPVFSVLLPVYGNRVLEDPLALGVLLGSRASGAFLGAVGYGAVGHRLSRHRTFVGAFLLSGIPLGVLAFTGQVLVAASALAVAGLAFGSLNPLIETVVQERTPSAMRARVFGALIAVAWTAMPIGMVVAGIAVDAFGIRASLAFAAIALVIVTGLTVRDRALRGLDAPTAQPS